MKLCCFRLPRRRRCHVHDGWWISRFQIDLDLLVVTCGQPVNYLIYQVSFNQSGRSGAYVRHQWYDPLDPQDRACQRFAPALKSMFGRFKVGCTRRNDLARCNLSQHPLEIGRGLDHPRRRSTAAGHLRDAVFDVLVSSPWPGDDPGTFEILLSMTL